MLLKLTDGNVARIVNIHILEKPSNSLDVHLLVGNLCLYDQIFILLSRFNCTLTEDSCHNVEHCKVGKRDENGEYKNPDPTNVRQGEDNDVPADTARYCFEEREHTAGKAAPVPVKHKTSSALNKHDVVKSYVITFGNRDEMVCRSLCEENPKDIDDHHQEKHRPYQRLHGADDGIHQSPKSVHEPDHADDAEDADEPRDANNANDPHVARVLRHALRCSAFLRQVEDVHHHLED
mmetsp:Transcript_58003/g.106706  ORF Transcript_58003/g.106706 Transcript_58003/m.106706 type:complete len:235 (+) Transcript_58003:139-843(+)